MIENKNAMGSLAAGGSKIFAAYDALAAAQESARYVLCLYITGTAPRSMKAIANIRKICEEHLPGRYDLDIVDISMDPSVAQVEQIVAVPTLVKKLPLPSRRFVGDMSHTEKILLGLDLRTQPTCGVIPGAKN